MLNRQSYRFALPLTRRHVGGLIGVIAGLNFLVLLGAYLRHTYPTWLARADWKVRFLANQFNIAGENNFAAWYSSLLLLAVALAAILCFVLDRRQGALNRERFRSYGWTVIAFLFVGLSLDEAGSLHEALPSIEAVTGTLDPIAAESLHSWVGLLIVPIAAVGLFFVGFAMLRLRENPAALALVILGTLLFLSVPAQEQLEVESMAGDPDWVRPPVLMILEEGAEIFGSFAFLAAFLDYARRQDRLNAATTEFQPGVGIALSIVGVLTFGVVAVLTATGRVLHAQPAWGIPLNWFPGVLAFLTSLAVFYLWRQNRQRTAQFRETLPFLLLALFSLFLSFDHGAAQNFAERLSAARDAHRLILDVGFTGLILLIGISIGMQSIPRAGRLLIAGWVVLSVAALLAGGTWNPLLSFAAFALLFPGVLGGLLSITSVDPIRPRDHR